MNSSFLYHAWGLYDHKCSGIEYKGNTIILHIETKTLKKTVVAVGCALHRGGRCHGISVSVVSEWRWTVVEWWWGRIVSQSRHFVAVNL